MSPEFDQVRLYQQMGFLAKGAPMPFIGTISFLASSKPDSTHVLFALSIANSSLTFARENDRFRAGYSVTISLKSAGATVKQSEAHESVLVASFKETGRIDESVIYQEFVTAKPGRYQLELTVRDDGSSRAATENVTLNVPALGNGAQTLSTPVSFIRVAPRASLESFPNLVANPQSSATFGRDSVIGLYLETYDAGAAARLPLNVTVATESGARMFADTISIARHGSLYSGVVYLKASRIGIGPATIAFSRPGSADTVRAAFFVGFGEDLPTAGYTEMIDYLRWFATPGRLKSLRDTAPEFRAGAWAEFLKANASMTGANDALRDYFRRLRDANQRFQEEGTPGWKTDRGKVLLGLGDPDAVYEQQPSAVTLGQRGRNQIWEYRALNLQLVFYDQTGYGRWRLTNSSDLAFTATWRRRLP
ncbi:MAG: GWxTD domain-containing protein [Gemmatimonadetes bacterium]|nr:GWxTD domain-containing protein [Gemmatimonadota bacterium]